MSIYNIGLDFGTSQSKICSKNMESGNDFIFHKFSLNDKYMLPSTIKVLDNGTIAYGLNEPNLIRYFKMKALFDKDPNYTIQRDNNHDVSGESLAQYPELCCILYLAYCLIDVKYSFSTKTKVKKQKSAEADKIGIGVPQKTGLLSKLFKKKEVEKEEVAEYDELIENKHSFIITVGIPTQYDNTNEEKEKRSKQYEMVYLAMKLAAGYSSPNAYTAAPLNDLLEKISKEYEQLPKENLTDTYYNKEHGILVIAETTAGIISFRNEIQKLLSENNHENILKEYTGNYITMDIGAGTTDISFFKLYYEADKNAIKLNYYASKSINIASNYLIKRYLKTENENKISQFDTTNINPKKWRTAQNSISDDLFKVIRDTIFPRLRQIYHGRPQDFRQGWHFIKDSDNNNIRSKGCRVYGGGSRFSEFSDRTQILYNGGRRNILNAQNHDYSIDTYLIKLIYSNEMVLDLRKSNGDQITKNDDEYLLIKNSLDILNIALGLAQVDIKNRPDGENGWIELYQFENENEQAVDNGLANYDVYNRDWI
jgi:hypothetical protein